MAIVGLAALGTRTAFENERQTVAQGLINQHIERIRVLGYDNVGYTAPGVGEPDGTLLKQETRSQNSQNYTIETTVTLVDDPLNGNALPLNETTADYKKVEITATWQHPNGAGRSSTVVTYVARGTFPASPTPSPTPSPSPTPTPSIQPSTTPTSQPIISTAPFSCPGGIPCLPGGAYCWDCFSSNCSAPSSGFTTGGYCYYTTYICGLTAQCTTTIGTACIATTTYYPCINVTPTPSPSTIVPTPTPTPSVLVTPSPSTIVPTPTPTPSVLVTPSPSTIISPSPPRF